MLYLVGTPIGNLNDLSIRQAQVIMGSDVILAEDTRSFETLKKKAQALYRLPANKTQVIESYYKDNEMQKLPEIIDYLLTERNVALLTESGMPLICDPGYLLVKTVISNNIPFTLIPGPTAFVSAVVLSGFSFKRIFFVGFVPKKRMELVKSLSNAKKIKDIYPDTVVVFYESPHRIKRTLEEINSIFPDNQVAVVREISKRFEEVIRGTAKTLINFSFRGELTVVLA